MTPLHHHRPALINPLASAPKLDYRCVIPHRTTPSPRPRITTVTRVPDRHSSAPSPYPIVPMRVMWRGVLRFDVGRPIRPERRWPLRSWLVRGFLVFRRLRKIIRTCPT